MQLSYSSIPEMVLSQAKRYGEKPVMRAKRNGTWERITWNGLIESARNTALGLASLGLKEGDRVSILSENRPEWAVADLGTLFAGGFDAPIYTTNTPEQCAYIVRDCGARFIFVSTGLLLAKILEKLDTMPTLEKIICFDSPESRGNEKIMTLENLQEIGKAFTDKSVIEGRIAR
ncbi:MAG: AMP-binding protein, partial [Deltaproteobacteria bacterium]|nr:AMP-binding protein [Deltaproteobacteria bacterium]